MARILVVGTDTWCEHVGTVLEGAGYEVTRSHDALQAARLSLATMPSAVVTQSTLARASGFQLCRLVQAERPLGELPVIIMSSPLEAGSAFQARAAGATAHVEDEAALLRSLSRILARPQLPSPATFVDEAILERRLSTVLDRALRDGEIAADVRALSNVAGLQELFAGLVELVSEVVPCAWLGLVARSESDQFLLHAAESDEAAESEARMALGVDDSVACQASWPGGARAAAPDLSGSHLFEAPIFFGDSFVGQLAVAFPTPCAADVKRTMGLVAYELGGPLKIISLLEQVQRQAATDALTGLVNRRALQTLMTRERARAARSESDTSFLIIDIDHFKRVNDVYGHAAGDIVLRGLAGVLRESTRESDVVCRWGGEEFVVALPETDLVGALLVAERIREAVEGAKHELPEGDSLAITVSIGASTARGAWTFDASLAVADAALYEAKRDGRNRVVAGGASTSVAPRPGVGTGLKRAS